MVDREYGVLRRLQDRPAALFALAQCILRLPAVEELAELVCNPGDEPHEGRVALQLLA